MFFAQEKKYKNKRKKILGGVTIIEALTVLFIFSLITTAFYSVISLGIRYIQDSKNRLAALSVANERMEIVRNLKYDNILTSGMGGNIPEDEDVVENGKQFHVHTVIGYVDDDYDSIYANGDVIPGDYKKVIITVSWGASSLNNHPVELLSRFVPPGLEVLNPGDGILSINVFSDQPGGTGISGSDVHIVNPDTGLDTYQQTDPGGNVILVGSHIMDSIQKYRITVAKSGYETVATMPPYPDTPYNPTFTHASVAAGFLNVFNIIQNELADLKISTVGYLSQSIGNIDFHLEGGKQIGTEVYDPLDPTPSEAIYNLDMEETTNSSGEKDFSEISPGQYTFSLSPSVTNFEFIGTDPPFPYDVVDGKMIYVFPLSSDPVLTLKVRLADKNVTSLLVSVLNNNDGFPISGASVQLTNGAGYDVTQTTGVDGRVFFPTTADPFLSGIYDLKITADGFSDSSSQVTVDDNQLKIEAVNLTAIPI